MAISLGTRVNVGVQSLGRRSVALAGAPGDQAAQLAQSVTAAAGQINTLLIERNASKTREQVKNASYEMTKQTSQWAIENASRENYAAGEVPEGIDVRRNDIVRADSMGNYVDVPRQDIPAFEVQPKMYQQFMTSTIQAQANTIEDETARDNWSREMNELAIQKYAKAEIAAMGAQKDYNLKVQGVQIEDAVTAREYDSAVELIKTSDYTELEKKEMREGVRKQSEVDSYEDAIESRNPLMIKSQIDNLRSDTIASSLSGNEQNKYIGRLEKAYDASVAEEMARIDHERERAASNLEVGISENPNGYTDAHIDQAFDNGWITGAKRTQLMKDLRTGQKDFNEMAVTWSGIQNGYLDPGNKDHRKAADWAYEQGMIAVAPEDVVPYSIDFMKTYKIVPDAIQGTMRAANRGNKQQVESAVALYKAAMRSAPTSMVDLTDSEIGIIKTVSVNMDLGMDLSTAHDTAMRWDAITPNERQTIMATTKASQRETGYGLGDSLNQNALQSFIGQTYDIPWDPSDPTDTMHMNTQFNNLTNAYLPQVGGDNKAAQGMAWETMKPRWGLTNINGEYSLMEYAPQGNQDAIRKDVVDTYPEGAIIKSDLQTRREAEAGQPLTYSVITVDEETGSVSFLKRWTMDVEGMKARSDRKVVEKAREMKKVNENVLSGVEAHREALKKDPMHVSPISEEGIF